MEGQMTLDQFLRWQESFIRAWEEQDTDLFVSLFSEDASYQDTPYTVPFKGCDFRAFWDGLAREQKDNSMRFTESHLLSDNKAFAVWTCETTTLRHGGQRREASGVMLLTFAADGRCTTLREWQHSQVIGTPHEVRRFPKEQ